MEPFHRFMKSTGGALGFKNRPVMNVLRRHLKFGSKAVQFVPARNPNSERSKYTMSKQHGQMIEAFDK